MVKRPFLSLLRAMLSPRPLALPCPRPSHRPAPFPLALTLPCSRSSHRTAHFPHALTLPRAALRLFFFCALVSPAHPAAASSPAASDTAPAAPRTAAHPVSSRPTLSQPASSSHISSQSGALPSVVVKSTANRGETNVGDYWIGEDFAAGFQTLGATTDTDYRGEYHRPHSPEPALNLYMRGYTDFIPPFPPGCNVLYAYYPMAYTAVPTPRTLSAPAADTASAPAAGTTGAHSFSAAARNAAPVPPLTSAAAAPAPRPLSKSALNRRPPQPADANLDDDWQNFDVIAVASPAYAAELNRAGIKAVYVPQFTNPEKFYPDPDPALTSDILFVGSNWHDRTSLRYALEAGFTVAVYGYNWQGIVPPEMYKAPYIANTELNRYYSSAKIVLNDHRPDMKDFGFVNNRIYDATAAGALVISDYMPEIEAAYGDAVPMYKNKEELARLLEYYLAHEDERLALAAKARRITLEKFTNAAAARAVLEAARASCPLD